MSRLVCAVSAFAIIGLLALSPADKPTAYAQDPPAKKSPAEDAAGAVRLADKNLKVEVWASEPHLANPVAFAFDEKGRCFVVETFRHTQGVPDTRGKPWLDDDLAARTVADRVAMYKKFKYGQYPENSERLRLLWDSTGSGKVDKDSVFADGFNRYEDGIAAGVLARKGDVFFACIPDLYRFRDPKGENKGTEKTSLATGFGIHVQFIGHDLHGLRMGPDGKLYMSIGDRGLNIITKEQRHLMNPDSGAVLRCDPDGSNLEIVHMGLRNPQEIAFDDFGNLFTYDNNCDSGDRARWVQIVEGGDSGWRCGFQYGTGYHTPAVQQGNRGPWNTEKLWLPQWDGQPAYILPPLLNFGSGPSGMTHYPGIGLNEKYKDHFFCTDFTGGPGGSKIWTLAVKPKGATFEVIGGSPKEFIGNMLPTDCEFGPDGAFYWSDWTTGWDKPGKGRIFRVTDPEAMKNPAVAEAKKLIAEGFDKRTADELEKLLEHPHHQVRQEAQYELVSLGADGRFAKVARDSRNRLARLHAVWGLGAIARKQKDRDPVARLFTLVNDTDVEVRRAAIEQLGNAAGLRMTLGDPSTQALHVELAKLMTDADLRVRAAAAVTYGKVGQPEPLIRRPTIEQVYYAPLFEVLKANDDKDPYLRHAAVMGLFHAARNPVDLWNVWVLSKDKYDIASVRMGVLLALRKAGSDKVAEFLNDPEPKIVAEAARAIYDDRLTSALPALAKLADKSALSDATAFRAIAANTWLGTPEPIARFAGRAGEPDYTRAFALELLGKWADPGRRDPITGITMELKPREAKGAAEAVKTVGVGIFAGSDIVRKQAAQVVAKLGIKEFGPLLAGLVKDEKTPVSLRVDALFAVDAINSPETKDLAALALASTEPKLRAAGRGVKAKADPIAVMKELPELLKDTQTSLAEKQGAFAILAGMKSSEDADKLLDEWLDAAIAAKVPGDVVLDVLDAADKRASAKLKLFAPLKAKVDKYRAAQNKIAADPKGDKLAGHLESLAGGDADRGRSIFLNNSSVYCQRCHKLDGQGGEVGPQLNGIAAEKEKDRRYLLEAIVLPSANIAKGFETVILVLQDERTVSGIIKAEDKKTIKLLTAENKEIVIPVEDVASRRTGPSAMPADLHTKLSRRELRDVVEFLSSLKEPLKK
ncbi:MAG: c-type cytochrome [Planctomycetes bacterium]|nr:c-type cytochrome [Planctomycetota bacterium]